MNTTETENTEIVNGNMKLRISVSGAIGEIQWIYKENEIDFQTKALGFVFENRVLKELTDGWFLFTVGSTTVEISSSEAIGIAKDPIEFESVDGKPVTILILLISPTNQTGPHIQALASISKLMLIEEFRQALENADSADEVYNLLSSKENE